MFLSAGPLLCNPDTVIKPTSFFSVFIFGWSTVSFSEATEIRGNLSEKVMALIALIKTKFCAESVILSSVLLILPSLQVKNGWNYREFSTQTEPYLGKYFHALFKNQARQYIYGKLTAWVHVLNFRAKWTWRCSYLASSKQSTAGKTCLSCLPPLQHMCFAHVQEMFSVAKIIFVQKRQIIQDFLVHLQAYT